MFVKSEMMGVHSFWSLDGEVEEMEYLIRLLHFN